LATPAEAVARKAGIFDLSYLPLRNPDKFVAGGIHDNFSEWERITTKLNVLDWIRHGVDIGKFFRPFKGNFKGEAYNSDIPPPAVFPNNPSCKEFGSFIAETLLDRVRNGSLMVWGKVGVCDPPYLVMPLTVEPTKPRLCHDERYLNLWVEDSAFSLDTLKEVPRMVSPGMYMTTLDDKSGYDHVRLAENTSTFFGLQFGEWFLAYNTLPFGFKASAYIYQTIGMAVTSYCRSLGVPCLQYIDDRLIGELLEEMSKGDDMHSGNVMEALRALYIVCEILSRVGYTLGLQKSKFIPAQLRRFLGLFTDSVRQAFLLPDEKREKFAVLRDDILSREKVGVKTLQRFAGKCISFILAIPAAKLYTREVNRAISRGMKNSKQVDLVGELLEEIRYWVFLDTWVDYLPWRSERHVQVSLFTDASLYRWGAVVRDAQGEASLGDYWTAGDNRPIHLKEAQALASALSALSGRVADHRVDVSVDNMAVVQVWNGESGRDSQLIKIVKELFQTVYRLNVDLRVHYIPSKQNPADEVSRRLKKSDAMLTEEKWGLVQDHFGPHSVDLMALDSNVMKDSSGLPLRHFTPYPTPGSSGVNVFAQDLSQEENLYVFPPFLLIAPLLKFLMGSACVCTVVVPMSDPLPVWWPTLWYHATAHICVGVKSEKGVISLPSKRGFKLDSVGLSWPLLAVRLVF
jgi:hypothetical protein